MIDSFLKILDFAKLSLNLSFSKAELVFILDFFPTHPPAQPPNQPPIRESIKMTKYS